MMRPKIGFKRITAEGFKRGANGQPVTRMARWNGEPMRAPKKGELFISGAVPVAYKAKADMTTEYFIAQEVNE